VKVTGTKSMSVYPVRGWSAFNWKAILVNYYWSTNGCCSKT